MKKDKAPVQEKTVHKPVKKPEASTPPVDDNFRGIVRIAGKDVPGKVPLHRALTRVRGIGLTLNRALALLIHTELGIDPVQPVGKLSEQDVEKIDGLLFNAHKYPIPPYLFNRQRDVLDGQSRHLIMNDLLFTWGQDIEREKKLYTWRGYRHSYGQKVRGQRTRNTGRTGMAVGVLRKAVIAAQQPAEGRGGRAEAAKPAAPGAPAAKAAPAAGKAPPAGVKPAPTKAAPAKAAPTKKEEKG